MGPGGIASANLGNSTLGALASSALANTLWSDLCQPAAAFRRLCIVCQEVTCRQREADVLGMMRNARGTSHSRRMQWLGAALLNALRDALLQTRYERAAGKPASDSPRADPRGCVIEAASLTKPCITSCDKSTSCWQSIWWWVDRPQAFQNLARFLATTVFP